MIVINILEKIKPINPCIIPSIINGALIKYFLAPCNSKISIKFYLDSMLNFIILEILNTLTIKTIIPIKKIIE